MIGLAWLGFALVTIPFLIAFCILGVRAIRNDRARREALRISSIWHRDCGRDDVQLVASAERLRKFLQGEQ